MMGYPCHIVHNTAEKAGVALARVIVVVIQLNLIFGSTRTPKERPAL